MATQANQNYGEKLSCSICLELLKDPVTIPCGHSYCMSCIKGCWDEEDEKKKTHSCPQCRQSFTPRPVLMKNTMLAELVEEVKKSGLEDAPSGHFYAGPGDVACDFCSGPKLKALKSCLTCLASFCEQHLQPHYDVAPLKKHKLVAASSQLRDNVCSCHDEVMKIFCRTDRRCICYLCTLEEHKDHDTVTVTAERAERQAELEASRKNLQQRVLDAEKEVEELRQRVESVDRSADQAVRDSARIFNELIRLIEKRSSELEQQIRSQQRSQVGGAKELEEKLQQEITELRRRDAELEQLERTQDHLHFLNRFPSPSRPDRQEDSRAAVHLRGFSHVAASVSEARDKVLAVLSEEWTKISLVVTGDEVSPPQAEPTTRDEFMKYSCQITLDPNTAHSEVSLSDGNRKATLVGGNQKCLDHTDRFIDSRQVLSRDGLTGRCYWEVNWSGSEVDIAVAYKNISRTGNESLFGNNDKSWSLECHGGGYVFRHNKAYTNVSGPESSRIGVYLDHRAGTLSYYSVSETMTLLHRVHTKFTHTLHPGFRFGFRFGVWGRGSTAELCELK